MAIAAASKGTRHTVRLASQTDFAGWRDAARTLALNGVDPADVSWTIDGNDAVAHSNFAALRTLRDELASAAPPSVNLRELSMGMSGDFEIAIAEGATIVRVGSSLFEGILP